MKGLRLGLSLTGGRFKPSSLFAGGGLGAAYDPTDLSTLFQLSNGTTAVTAHGDPIGYMGDTSGNANHALQSSNPNRPTLSVVGAVKSLGVASASTHNLVIPAAMLSGWTSGTIVFAAKRAADPPGASADGPIIGGAGTSGASNHYPFTDGVVYSDFLSTVRKTAGDPGDMAAWHTGDFRSAANSWIAAFNGTDYHTTGTNTVGAGTAPIIGQVFDGLIGRMIIINRVLTGIDLANARTWCAAGFA